MEDLIREKYVNTSPEPISIESTEKILEQMKKYVCKIYNKKEGTGFFTRIPYKSILLPVLITNNHIINENDIKNNKIISIYLNYENKTRNIKLDNTRKKYTNEILDVTIIEIKENKDNIKYFLELDKNIIDSLELNKEEITNKLENVYSNKSIYILNYPEGNNVMVSYGPPPRINNEKIEHKCSTKGGSSGSPILLTENQKLIGVHYGTFEKKYYNIGTLIIYPIIEFQKIETNILNEMIIKYNIKNKDEKIKLFGTKFIKNNKDKCKIIVEGIEQEICEYLDINENMKNKGILEIKLKEIKTITNMSYMFCNDNNYDNCCSLLSFSDISKWDTKNVTDMSLMFCGCDLLSELPDISKWDTKNVRNINGMFFGCSSLLSLPDISKWNTSNVTDMGCVFCICKSLSSLPDISKWDTKKVTNMNGMFYGCSSLLSLPDISKWDIKNVIDMKNMFYGCNKSLTIPSKFKK